MIKATASNIMATADENQIHIGFNVTYAPIPSGGFVLPKAMPKKVFLDFPIGTKQADIVQKIKDNLSSLNHTLARHTRKLDNNPQASVDALNTFFAGKTIP